MQIISEAGYEVSVVGGAVRDMLLSREPKEYDICTDACPRAVMTLAAENKIKAYRKGAAFGVMAWILEGEEIEIATYRTEIYGKDAHRPEKVEFVWALEDDLARRDFTVNAMAMNLRGEIFDPFGGRKALEEKILRAVGDPEERFEEDALRIFRACRFVAEYGFRIEDETREAIVYALPRVAGLSVERVRDEIEKILLAPEAVKGLRLMQETGLFSTACRCRSCGSEEIVPVLPELDRLVGIEQNPAYHSFDVWEHTLRVVENITPEPLLRWAALLHDIAKGTPGVRRLNKHGLPADYGHARVGAEIAFNIMNRLRMPPSFTGQVAWLVREHMDFPAPTEEAVVKWLKRLSSGISGRKELTEATRQSLILRGADLLGGKVDSEETVRENVILENIVQLCLIKVPFYVEDLVISGGEVASLVGRGPQVKQMLNILLERVQNGDLPNQQAALREAVRKKALRMGITDPTKTDSRRKTGIGK
jgi:tRNA nucleotidyltransferase/poly(A) polymerase